MGESAREEREGGTEKGGRGKGEHFMIRDICYGNTKKPQNQNQLGGRSKPEHKEHKKWLVFLHSSPET